MEKDKLTQEVRKVLQSVALHGYDLICAESDIVKAIQSYHEAKLKEELMRFCAFKVSVLPSEPVLLENYVDEYLNNK